MSNSKKALTKSDLAQCLVEKCQQYDTVKEANKAIDAVLGCLEMNLKEGNKISLTGFGNFEIKHRPERQGRNPSNGQSIVIKAANAVSFKAGKGLKEAVNQ